VNQPLPLVEQLKNLEHLQELDLKIDSLKKGQNSLPAGLKVIDDSLNKIRASVEIKKNQVTELEKLQRQTQAALDLNQDRLTRSNGKLEAVHNSQEFQAANKEIEQLKKLNTSLEEQNKKTQTDMAAVKQELGTLTEQLQKLQVERDSKASVLSGQDHELKSSIASLMAERQKYIPNVENRILAQYDRIRSARGGLGIVPAIGGRCKGCNMMVPPQLYNEVQRGTMLHSCPSCNRLLFIPASTPASSSQPEQGAKAAVE
jgi:predicted  nucleic acid-binding Zn-ribbon protein